ncbi:hypothetical protein ONE63_009296 [Megalurothrips usitatus]|uniref:Macro domain-containing protein n=1 Tax=Megalurothrips usitatus TaxID=439358 RepID=A0AAV7XJ77_9NEOP|nr:hypothetical protein ONE63_009296 [Megalurothrips usitatus]
MAFIHDKEKYLALSLDEKRKVYKSSGGYCTLEDIKTWPSYFRSNQERLVQQYEDSKGKIGLEKFDARPELADKISLWKGDITTLEIDAIVNAANSTLLGGGGVDGAIHRAAGASLKVECSSLNGCKVGEAKITGGYMLPAKYVIHTVGPQGEIPAALQGCYDSCLNLLRNQKLKSIAFPCISTGIYGYPQEAAAKVALKTVRTFMEQNHEEVDRIIFCLFLPTDVAIYENLLQVFFPTS